MRMARGGWQGVDGKGRPPGLLREFIKEEFFFSVIKMYFLVQELLWRAQIIWKEVIANAASMSGLKNRKSYDMGRQSLQSL